MARTESNRRNTPALHWTQDSRRQAALQPGTPLPRPDRPNRGHATRRPGSRLSAACEVLHHRIPAPGRGRVQPRPRHGRRHLAPQPRSLHGSHSSRPNRGPSARAPSREALAIAASPDRQVKSHVQPGHPWPTTLPAISIDPTRQLLELQKIRHDREKRELDQLVDIIEMYKSKGQIYIPATDGFVFTEDQIKQAIRARNRERLAKEALPPTV